MSGAMSLTPLNPMQLIDSLIPQPDGTVVAMAEGTVISCQPDGSLQRRPAGTAGQYEKATLNGNTLTYKPATEATGQLFSFAYVPTVPNV